MEILRVEGLNFAYPKSSTNALNDINFSVNSGEFVVLYGMSGCGKTTLLRMLKKQLAPFGKSEGHIFYNGVDIKNISDEITAARIGFVMQNPDEQIVTDKVWHELAFGLENLGLKTNVIRRRVGEMASYFGIQDWFRKNTDELSGGQKQLLNLASVMVMQPKILILDEPTGQLDPIAAADFISTLQRINRELGTTIILAEHRLEQVFGIADRVMMMENGSVIFYDTPEKAGKDLSGLNNRNSMLCALPAAVRIYNGLDFKSEKCPVTVKEGREFLQRHFSGCCNAAEDRLENVKTVKDSSKDIAIELKNVWFRYERELPDVLRGVDLTVASGDIFCLLGGNGTGKTTTLNVISGISKPYRGNVIINKKNIKSYKNNSLYRCLQALPQNPRDVFIKDTVRDDFLEALRAVEIPKSESDKIIESVSSQIGIEHLLNRHPYDLSGGEQQKCALAKVLLQKPDIILLDEPTKGLDAAFKESFKKILFELKENGITILIVTHDIEFAAETADCCALFFDGEILSQDSPDVFFAENSFYTTAANRIARDIWKNAVTCSEVIKNCRMTR